MIPWEQYAEAELDYAVDFSGVLNGDALVSATVEATHGVVVTAKQLDGDRVTFRISGGEPGAVATVICKGVSANGLKPEAKPQIRILA